jgi:(2Fe-2S) ferredoxin
LTAAPGLVTLVVVAERRFRILVCRGPECGDRRGSRAIYEAFRATLGEHAGRCELTWQSCFGRCTQGPNCLVREITEVGPPRFAFAALPGPRGVTALYNHLDPVNVSEIVAEHIGQGVIVRRLIEPTPTPALVAPATGDPSGGDP